MLDTNIDNGSYNLNQDGTFMDINQIVDDVVNCRLGDQDTKNHIQQMNSDDLISLHQTMGRWIRNSYGLWLDQYPHLNNTHPDDFSFEAIKLIHNRITKQV
jgi:hypothetical protein